VAPRASLRATTALAVLTLLALPAGSDASAAGGPVVSAAPTVIGTAAAGKRLTGLSGTWGGFGRLTYRFQWYRCNAAGAACLSIHGATSPTFPLGDRDVGKTLGLTVTATDSTGTASAFASLVGPIAPRRPLLESTAQPVVTGPPIQGKTVQVTTGTWSPVPAKLAYRWVRCNPHGRACATIPNASSGSYTVSSSDLGHALVAIVQATNGGTVQNAFSTSTPPVVDGSVRGPSESTAPYVSGNALVGEQLSASNGIWTGVGPVVFNYRWYRCDGSGGHCTAIHTDGGPVYTLARRDAGSTIGLTLRVSDSTGAVSVYGPLIGPVAPADAALTPTAPPAISGPARVGATLSADDGSWTSVPTETVYTWLRCNANGRLCDPIPGANRATYRPRALDSGHTLIVSVDATAGGDSQSALSAPTARIP
jgi:hypothetical protein